MSSRAPAPQQRSSDMAHDDDDLLSVAKCAEEAANQPSMAAPATGLKENRPSQHILMFRLLSLDATVSAELRLRDRAFSHQAHPPRSPYFSLSIAPVASKVPHACDVAPAALALAADSAEALHAFLGSRRSCTVGACCAHIAPSPP